MYIIKFEHIQVYKNCLHLFKNKTQYSNNSIKLKTNFDSKVIKGTIDCCHSITFLVLIELSLFFLLDCYLAYMAAKTMVAGKNDGQNSEKLNKTDVENDQSEKPDGASTTDGTATVPAKSDNGGGRKRKRHLFNAIRTQMEFYFGDANLSKDRFLRKYVEQDPCKCIFG